MSLRPAATAFAATIAQYISTVGKANSDMCWAIVAAEAVAAGLRLMGGKETVEEFASQELLDCCKEHETECYTYSLKKAFKWIEENGIREKGDYPFLAKKCMCRPKGKELTVGAERIKGIAEVNSLDTIELMKAVVRQPVAGR
ncbi:hypothetical protein Vadar_018530 [Vaccinium darrowii]|uniref:Uncharacterized protein n=1 Tax=Vaccinium darrowii TaxID=229202 RepID=A0ACB7XID3_9ERIC|nr:hypothetical protein Vadar_018530 [Vaccinium darrowii]